MSARGDGARGGHVRARATAACWPVCSCSRQAPRGVLVINNATGYLREFYLKFAAYCAQRGYHALVYDYRGMGASASDAAGARSAPA